MIREHISNRPIICLRRPKHACMHACTAACVLEESHERGLSESPSLFLPQMFWPECMDQIPRKCRLACVTNAPMLSPFVRPLCRHCALDGWNVDHHDSQTASQHPAPVAIPGKDPILGRGNFRGGRRGGLFMFCSIVLGWWRLVALLRSVFL